MDRQVHCAGRLGIRKLWYCATCPTTSGAAALILSALIQEQMWPLLSSEALAKVQNNGKHVVRSLLAELAKVLVGVTRSHV